MILPHLIFSHLLADYVLQTDWLVKRKSRFVVRELRSWDGLLLHGFILWLVTLGVLAAYAAVLWPFITALAILHTLQDAFKTWLGPRPPTHPIYLYSLDQLAHLMLLLLLQPVVADLIVSPPDAAQTELMLFGAALIAITRFYEVTWWANWPATLPYMKRWRIWGYLERISMMLLSAIGLWHLAPLALFPRLFRAYALGYPITASRYGLADLLLGMTFSVILGLAL